MYVVSFADFMNMRSVQSHQELVSQGLLVEFQSQMGDAFFVSHQWTGSAHPDLKFEQLRVLQRAFDYLMGGQTLLKSTHMSYAMLGHGEYISTKDWHSHFMFIWYDYFSCPQLVSRSAEQAILPDLQNAVQSISSYVQKSKYFLVLVPSVHADTGELLSRESWQRRGWCRFERACREFLSEDANIAVIESVHRSYVMTPFDSWLKPACMGEFTVEGDRDKVGWVRAPQFHRDLVTDSSVFKDKYHDIASFMSSLDPSTLQALPFALHCPGGTSGFWDATCEAHFSPEERKPARLSHGAEPEAHLFAEEPARSVFGQGSRELQAQARGLHERERL